MVLMAVPGQVPMVAAGVLAALVASLTVVLLTADPEVYLTGRGRGRGCGRGCGRGRSVPAPPATRALPKKKSAFLLALKKIWTIAKNWF